MKRFPAITGPVTLSALILVVALSGCASAPVPSERLAVAEAAVQRANSRSTSESAPAELQIAIAKLASARQAVNSEDYELAAQLAEQAEVDAQVAELHAQLVRSRIAAEESQKAAQILREETNRGNAR